MWNKKKLVEMKKKKKKMEDEQSVLGVLFLVEKEGINKDFV